MTILFILTRATCRSAGIIFNTRNILSLNRQDKQGYKTKTMFAKVREHRLFYKVFLFPNYQLFTGAQGGEGPVQP